MGRKQLDDDLLLEDELTAAFLSEEPMDEVIEENIVQTKATPAADDNSWESEPVPGQLSLDVYETRDRLYVKARTAGVNRNELDVSIADNTLTIRGTLNAGTEDDVIHYHAQECFWGEFSRTIALPVAVKEDEIQATLKDGVLTISFAKVKQDTFKKITIT